MRDVTPDIDNKEDFLADYEPFLPDIFRESFRYIPKQTLNKRLDELDKMAMATPADRSFKILFWRKLRDCEKLGTPMSDGDARCGVLSKATLQLFADTGVMLAWLLTPDMPADVSAEVKLVDLGKQLEILTKYSALDRDVPEINYKLLDLQMKMFAMLDKRVNGDFLQKIDQRSLNVTKNITEPKKSVDPKLSLEDQVKKLTEQIEHKRNLGGNSNLVLEGEKDGEEK